MKFYKTVAQQNVRGLNLKFYPARSRRGLNNPRKFSGKRGEQRKFSVAKFTRRSKLTSRSGIKI